jgi:hypothetical protein
MTVRRKHIGELARKILVQNSIEAAPVDFFQIAKQLNLEVEKKKA